MSYLHFQCILLDIENNFRTDVSYEIILLFSNIKLGLELAVVAHAWNSSSRETQAGEHLQIQVIWMTHQHTCGGLNVISPHKLLQRASLE